MLFFDFVCINPNLELHLTKGSLQPKEALNNLSKVGRCFFLDMIYIQLVVRRCNWQTFRECIRC